MSRKFDLNPNSEDLEDIARQLEELHLSKGGDSGNTVMRSGKLSSVNEPVPAGEVIGEEAAVPASPSSSRSTPDKFPLPLSAILFRAGMVALSLALLGVIFLLIKNSRGPVKYAVPNIVGQQVTSAMNRIPRELRPVVEYDTGSESTPGTVLKVTPGPGTRLSKNESITVTVAGRREAASPDDAEASLPDFQPEPEPENAPPLDPDSPPDETSQPDEPAQPDDTAQPDGPSTPDEAPLPAKKVQLSADLIGMQEARARDLLEKDGINIATARGEDLSRDNGAVLAVSPGPGNEVESGSTVTLTINNLSRFVTVPNRIGDHGDVVVDDLRRLGLVPKTEYQSGGQSGNVVRLDPPPGSLLKPGEEITVHVAR